MRCEKVLKTFWPPSASLKLSVKAMLASRSRMWRPSSSGESGAANEPGVEVVDPGAEIVHTAQQVYPAQALGDGGVPAEPGNAALQTQDTSPGVSRSDSSVSCRVGIVHRVTEGRVASQLPPGCRS